MAVDESVEVQLPTRRVNHKGSSGSATIDQAGFKQNQAWGYHGVLPTCIWLNSLVEAKKLSVYLELGIFFSQLGSKMCE